MNSVRPKLLIVDDDPIIRRALRFSLMAQGYAVEDAGTGEQAIEFTEERKPDLILLDIDMPGMGGVAACRSLRVMLPQAGIVMITVCDAEDDKICALEAGADDYITKPFSVRELIARLRAIERRLSSRSEEDPVLQIGDLELDIRHRVLRKARKEVHLSPIEFNLLSYLMQHADVPIEHAKLLRAVWGPEYGSELEYLRTYIKRLRRKIEQDPLQPAYLTTLPWLGYCFCSKVKPSESSSDTKMESGAE